MTQPRATARANYSGMVVSMDEALGNLTSAIRAAGMWNNTLMVLFGDNGGAVPDGGRNWPVKQPLAPLLGPLEIAVSFWCVCLLKVMLTRAQCWWCLRFQKAAAGLQVDELGGGCSANCSVGRRQASGSCSRPPQQRARACLGHLSDVCTPGGDR